MKSFKREYTDFVSVKVKALLDSLIGKHSIIEYREMMFQIGLELGKRIISENPHCKYFYLVCTVEDADYLAKGIMQSFQMNEIAFNFACFWNQREETKDEASISPVIRKYEEPYSPPGKSKGLMVIVKSIISGSCVVKTNIKEVIEKIDPQRIIVTAPVIHKDSIQKLEKEFDPKTVKMFDYIYFAKDFEKNGENVHPGIGGDVYKLLGFGTQNKKNKYTPVVVRERRSAYLA